MTDRGAGRDGGTDATARVVLVVGGAVGIGAAIVEQFARRGDHVVIADKDHEGALALRARLRSEHAEVDALECDATDPDSVANVVDAVVDAHGRLDVACNNAGREGGARLPFEEHSLDTYDAVMALNARGVFICMQREIPVMRRQQSGVIVNTCSIAGLGGNPFSPVYSASKHAVVGLTKSAALELAPEGIRVNAVAPGIVDTPMMERSFGAGAAEIDAIKSLHPIGRVATPEEIAAAIWWLASDVASFVTGVVLPVDGGVRAR